MEDQIIPADVGRLVPVDVRHKIARGDATRLFGFAT